MHSTGIDLQKMRNKIDLKKYGQKSFLFVFYGKENLKTFFREKLPKKN